jgi:Fe-S-cluster containining protein
MASSDKSYAQLQAEAAQGDEFARQFVSIFLPYPSREAAEAVAPQVVAAVLEEAGEASSQSDIYFYHCPYLGEDNRCTVYGTSKRPAICGSYPETPLVFVYENCAWQPWKAETHPDTLVAHALLALCTHWSQLLRASLSA